MAKKKDITYIPKQQYKVIDKLLANINDKIISADIGDIIELTEFEYNVCKHKVEVYGY